VYFVKDGDSWQNVASRDGWANPTDLCEYNFRTRVPEEINWYLKIFVGCSKSNDGKNYSFSSNDSVKMTDGSKQRGHIFTKTPISVTIPQLDDHDRARQAVLDLFRTCASSNRSQVGKPNEFGEGVVAEVAKTFGRYRRKPKLSASSATSS